MRPRLAILAMLAVGILLMGAGTGLAVSGISGSDDASLANYPTTTTTTPQGGAAGQVGGGGVGGLEQAKEPAAQEVAQVAATGDDSLALTGFAAIPIIVVGVGLLVGGLVMRRRTTQ
jgi:hypothetical protein